MSDNEDKEKRKRRLRNKKKFRDKKKYNEHKWHRSKTIKQEDDDTDYLDLFIGKSLTEIEEEEEFLDE